MRLLFASIPTYHVTLGKEQAYWHRLRRVGADRVFEAVTGLVSPDGKVSLCRGLWLIASAAKRMGHECRWVDVPARKPHVSREALEWAEQLWMYAVTPTFPICADMAKQGKLVNPNLNVFVGGPHTRHLAEPSLLDHPEIDFIEAVVATPDTLAALVNEPKAMPGIAWAENGIVRINHSISTMPYHDVGDPTVLGKALSEYYINTAISRGCCRTCAFCLEGQVPLQLRSFPDVQQELLQLERHLGESGVVHFFDTSLWAVPQRCLELCEFIAAETSIQHFSCDIEARAIHDNVLMALAKARMRSVAIGFESCRDDVLNFVGKNGTYADRIAIAKHVRKLMPRTAIKAYWLLGLPGSTPESLEDELKGIKEVLDAGVVDLVSVKLFVAYPGTPFFSEPGAYGLEVEHDFRRFDRFSLPPVCWPVAVGRTRLSEFLVRAERTVAECYASRLGISLSEIANSGAEPKRYNGPLYVPENDNP